MSEEKFAAELRLANLRTHLLSLDSGSQEARAISAVLATLSAYREAEAERMRRAHFTPLADQIDQQVEGLLRLIEEAAREIGRDDLPEAWAADLDEANDAADDARMAIDGASEFDTALDRVCETLRRIDEFDKAQAA